MDILSPTKENPLSLGISVNQMGKLFPINNTVTSESKVELLGKIPFVKIFPISKVLLIQDESDIPRNDTGSGLVESEQPISPPIWDLPTNKSSPISWTVQKSRRNINNMVIVIFSTKEKYFFIKRITKNLSFRTNVRNLPWLS